MQRRRVASALGAVLDVVVDEMLALKGYAGVFLQRRVTRFLKDAQARGWHHDDDFAVAGIYLGADPATCS